MWQSNRLMARRILLVGFIIALSFGIYYLVSWFLMGTITVTIPEGANAAINKVGLKNERVASSDNPGQQAFRLKKGEYVVVLTKDFSASKASVGLGYREKQAVELSLTAPADIYELSRAGSQSVGRAGTSAAYLNNDLGDIRDNNGNAVGKSSNFIARTVVFADDGSSQLLLENDGSGSLLRGSNTYALFNTGGDDENSPVFTVEGFGAIVTAAYDAAKNQYCVLAATGRLGWVTTDTGTLTAAGEIKEDSHADYIDCHNGVIAYAKLNQAYDAETKSKQRTTDVWAFINSDSKKLASGEITAIQLMDDRLVFVEKGAVKQRSLGDTATKTIFSTDNAGTTALLASGDQLYVLDAGEIWQLQLDTAIANRIVASPSLAGTVDMAVLPDGNLIMSITRGTTTGVYITSNDANIKAAKAALALKVPYSNPSFLVSQFFNGQKIVITVTNIAPIPSTGNMQQYQAANTAARAYIASLGINPAVIEVVYK